MNGSKKRQVKFSMDHHQNQEEGFNDVVKAKVPKTNPDIEVENQSLELQVFLNPLVMEYVVKHFPTHRLLLTLRRTCKLWNQIICAEYRKRKVKNEVIIRIDADGDSNTLIEKLSNCCENPFGSYILIDLPFSETRIQDLLLKIGSILTHLELQLNSNTCLPIANFRTLLLKQTPALVRLDVKDGRSSALEFWKNELHSNNCCSSTTKTSPQEETQKLPNLKEILLRIKTTNVHHETSEFLLINQLFDAAINLQLVEMINYNPRTEVLLNGILLEALKGKADNLAKVREINFGKRVFPQHLQKLVELSSRKSTSNKLQLKKFNLSSLSSECFIGNGLLLLNQFLALQASHLETLTTTSLNGNGKIHLPVMNSLKALNLEAEVTSRRSHSDNLSTVRFQSLNVNFPNLVNLTIKVLDWQVNPSEEESQVKQRRWTAFTSQLGHHNGITTLHLSLYKNGNYLQNLSSLLFPNVKSLKIQFGNQVSPQVWTVWSRLESLTVEVRGVKEDEIDSWLTGIPEESLEALRASKDERPNVNWKELLKNCTWDK